MKPACLVEAQEQRRKRIDVVLEGDSPPENNEPPCTPGKRHQLPDLSTAELFREFEHMMLRRKLRRDVDPSTAEAGYTEQEIQRHVLPLPKTQGHPHEQPAARAPDRDFPDVARLRRQGCGRQRWCADLLRAPCAPPRRGSSGGRCQSGRRCVTKMWCASSASA